MFQTHKDRGALRVLATIAAITMCGGLAACSTAPSQSGTAVDVAYAPSLSTNSFWTALNDSVVTDLREDGKNVELLAPAETAADQIETVIEAAEAGVPIVIAGTDDPSLWQDTAQVVRGKGSQLVLVGADVDPDFPVENAHLYGFNSRGEGQSLARWANQERSGNQVVTLLGTDVSDPIRLAALERSLLDQPLGMVKRVAGEDNGQKAFDALVTAYPDAQVLVVFDEEAAVGVGERIVACGDSCQGMDVVTVGGSEATLTALSEGVISYVVERSPMIGPQVVEIVNKLSAGQPVPSVGVAPNHDFDQSVSTDVIDNRGY